mgnify:CR=1 FL=1
MSSVNNNVTQPASSEPTSPEIHIHEQAPLRISSKLHYPLIEARNRVLRAGIVFGLGFISSFIMAQHIPELWTFIYDFLTRIQPG